MPLELRGLRQVPHADVVVEHVDLVDVAAHPRERDRQPQPVRVLRRVERQLPPGLEERSDVHADGAGGQADDGPPLPVVPGGARSRLASRTTCRCLCASLEAAPGLSMVIMARVLRTVCARYFALRLDQQVAGHLEVQRRAELGAVEGVDAGHVRLERDVLALARLEAEVDVVHVDREAVGLVLGLLDAREVQVHRVALVDLDLVGREVAAHDGHVDVDRVAVAHDALLAALDGVRDRARRCTGCSRPACTSCSGCSLSALIIWA